MGRDLVAVRSSWLRMHLDDIPDFVLGGPRWDLYMAHLARSMCGIASTMDNYWSCYPECEIPQGLLMHEPHTPSWSGEQSNGIVKMNEALYKDSMPIRAKPCYTL